MMPRVENAILHNNGARSKLIVFSGLPACGKSAVAEAVAATLGIPVFSKDWVEAPILRSGAASGEELGALGYELLTTLARRQLSFGQSAILDSVASRISIRTVWRELATEHNADWYVIECICSDEAVHRARLANRLRAIGDWPTLEWADVERARRYFEPWSEEHVVLEALHPFSSNVARAIAYVKRPLPGST